MTEALMSHVEDLKLAVGRIADIPEHRWEDEAPALRYQVAQARRALREIERIYEPDGIDRRASYD